VSIIAPNRVVYLNPLEESGPVQEPLMRFRLTYEGELKASGRDPENGQHNRMAPHKQAIRKIFHGQLRQFWQTNKFLREQTLHQDEIHIAPGQVPHFMGTLFMGVGSGKTLPLVEYVGSNFQRNGYRFVPLVCEEFSLLCNLNILFLRRDYPLGVISAGDLDNRVKTIIDALRMPQGAHELRGNESPAAGEDPFFCLLEDDDLVTGLTVESDMLLDPPPSGDAGLSQVKLVISVELKPDSVTMFNLGFA